jgi:hypothetical protein
MSTSKLYPVGATLFLFAIAGIFIPYLTTVVVALAAAYVGGAIFIAADYVVDELRRDDSGASPSE